MMSLFRRFKRPSDPIQALWRRIYACHPRQQPEAMRQADPFAEARISALETEIGELKGEWIVDRIRDGHCPAPDAMPFLDPNDLDQEGFYNRVAVTLVTVDAATAAICTLTTAGIPLAIRVVAAAGSVLLVLGLTLILPGPLASILVVNRTKDEARRPLHLLGAATGIMGFASIIPFIFAQRGSVDQSLDLALPLGLAGITVGFSTATAAYKLIARTYAQVLARTILDNIDELARWIIFRQDLARALIQHPFSDDPDPGAAVSTTPSPDRDGPPGMAVIKAGPAKVISTVVGIPLLALLIAGHVTAGPASPGASSPTVGPRVDGNRAVLESTAPVNFTYIRTVGSVVDSSGSLAPDVLEPTMENYIASLPMLVSRFHPEFMAISGWGAPSTWSPPGKVFRIPPHSSLPPDLISIRPAGELFPGLRRAQAQRAGKAKRLAQAKLDTAWELEVRDECAKAGAILRSLARAGHPAEKECSPISDLIARAARQDSTHLTIAFTDGHSCPPGILIPASSRSHLIIILIPTRGHSRSHSVGDALRALSGIPWITVLTAADIDPYGSWIELITTPVNEPQPSQQQPLVRGVRK